MRRTVLTLFVVTVAVMITAQLWAQDKLKEGDNVPGIFLRDLNGENFFLKDHLGDLDQYILPFWRV